MNIGFMEAMKLEQFDCVIFHDVDLLPQNDRNMYTCPDESVRHMSAYIDKCAICIVWKRFPLIIVWWKI